MSTRPETQEEFAALIEPYRRQIHVHCYRMLGSFDEAEDLVQETLLRAWRGRAGFEGRSMLRTWLYRIATNACLDRLKSRSRSAEPRPEERIQPYPDHLLGQIASTDPGPLELVIARETIELAYLTAIQHLSPKQRATLILRDALGLSAKETATLLEDSVTAVNSALQRARSQMRERMPERRLDWQAVASPTAAERGLLERYMAAIDRADVATLTALLSEDVRLTMPPYPATFQGPEEIATDFSLSTTPGLPTYLGPFRTVATAANRLPAVAAYILRPGDSVYRPLGIDVLRIEGDLVIEITRFPTSELFPAFGLPLTL